MAFLYIMFVLLPVVFRFDRPSGDRRQWLAANVSEHLSRVVKGWVTCPTASLPRVHAVATDPIAAPSAEDLTCDSALGAVVCTIDNRSRRGRMRESQPSFRHERNSPR